MDKRKRTILIFVIAIVAITTAILFMIYNNKSEDNINNVEKQLLDITQEQQEGLGFSNIQIQKSGATTLITGTVQSHKTMVVDVKLKMKLYYQSGNLGGMSETEVLDINPDEAKKFEITLMGDYTVCDEYEIQVIDVIEK